jgi:hypothetical protein
MRPKDPFDPLRERALRGDKGATVFLSNNVRMLGPLAAPGGFGSSLRSTSIVASRHPSRTAVAPPVK